MRGGKWIVVEVFAGGLHKAETRPVGRVSSGTRSLPVGFSPAAYNGFSRQPFRARASSISYIDFRYISEMYYSEAWCKMRAAEIDSAIFLLRSLFGEEILS